MIQRFKNSPQLLNKFKETKEWEMANEEQKGFFIEFFSGGNIFLTSPAGSGKSWCIDALFNFLYQNGVSVSKTALTGVAALNISGATLHSWCGIGLAEEEKITLSGKAFKNKRAKERVQNCSVLIIDEISMASADLLNKLEFVLRRLRFNEEPFGSLRILLVGDALQLPPVFRGTGDKLKFFFESEAWKAGNFKVIQLHKLVRQDENTPFAQLLQKIRFGYNEDLSLLESRIGLKYKGEIEPVKVFCKNVDIDKYNNDRYNKLTTEERVYHCRDTGTPNHSAFFDKNCPAPAILKLKLGAQVMLLKNIDVAAGLVNGSTGIVESFNPTGPIIKFRNGERSVITTDKWEIKEESLGFDGQMKYHVAATRNQIPLRLAYASSTHRLQGQTLDCISADLSEAFATGQVYSALSRVKSLDGLYLEPFSPERIKANKLCVDFYKENC